MYYVNKIFSPSAMLPSQADCFLHIRGPESYRKNKNKMLWAKGMSPDCWILVNHKPGLGGHSHFKLKP